MRVIFYVICITLMALFMWGLRSIMKFAGLSFDTGLIVGFGIVLGYIHHYKRKHKLAEYVSDPRSAKISPLEAKFQRIWMIFCCIILSLIFGNSIVKGDISLGLDLLLGIPAGVVALTSLLWLYMKVTGEPLLTDEGSR